MPTLEEEVMSQIKGLSIIIRTEAMHLEDKTRKPNLTVEEIEEQLGVISEHIGFLNDDIERYRVKKDAQHQATQVRDNHPGCPAPPRHSVFPR